MHSSSDNTPCASAHPLRPDPAAACEVCGAAGAFRFDGAVLCADCYAEQGSTCSPSNPENSERAGH